MDDGLLARCREGDVAARAEFCDRFRSVALRAAVRHGSFDAEDVVQATFEAILRAFDGGRGPVENAAGYVAVVARHVVLRSSARSLVPLGVVDDERLAITAEADSNVVLGDLLGVLRPEDRRVAYRAWVLDRPLDEIARVEGIPSANAVARRLARMRKILRDAVI